MMRIETYNCSQMGRVAATPGTGGPAEARPLHARGKGGGEPLSLSPLGSLVATAQTALRGLPAVREGRVNEVGMMVSSGRYQADAEGIAGAMLEAGSGDPSHKTTTSDTTIASYQSLTTFEGVS